MRSIGVIPARSGSKGIPDKNIKLMAGKPLIAYTIEAALESNIDKVVVSTNSEVIARISQKFGAEVIMRPEELACDDSPTIDSLHHVINSLKEVYDLVFTLQPTSPLRKCIHINESLTLFAESDADSLVSVVEVPHNYLPQKLMNYDGLYLQGDLKIKPRQSMSTLYARNGAAIYISNIERLKEQVLFGKIIPYFMTKHESIDIDDMEDWIIAEALLKGL